MPQSATLEAEITAALARGDDEEAAALLAAAFDLEPGTAPLPVLLEELAEYYATAGRHDDAVAAMTHALQRGWQGPLDGRCRIAEFLLHAGLVDDAESLFRTVAEAAPNDTATRYAAALEFWETGHSELAMRWATEGLQLALRHPAGPVTSAPKRRPARSNGRSRPRRRLVTRSSPHPAPMRSPTR